MMIAQRRPMRSASQPQNSEEKETCVGERDRQRDQGRTEMQVELQMGRK